MQRKVKTSSEVVGEVLKEIREAAGLKQREISDHIGNGNASMISAYETGERPIPVWKFIEFCRACQEDPAEVLEEILRSNPESFFPPEND